MKVVPIREGPRLPALIERAGPRTLLRFAEFFNVHIANANTRQAYARAPKSFLGCMWQLTAKCSDCNPGGTDCRAIGKFRSASKNWN